MEDFTAILIRDKNNNGYTAYVAEYPGVISEGKTKEEAKMILKKNLKLVLEHQKNQSLKNHTNSDVEFFKLI